MPAPIVGRLIDFITSQLSVTVWDGEVPRFSTQATLSKPIRPSTVTTPPVWPVIKLYMEESGFAREWTTEDPYTDLGEIHILVWSTMRAEVENLMNQLEMLLALAGNWAQISTTLGGPAQNPYYIIQMLLLRWYSGQEEDIRTGLSQLLYRGDMHYEVMLHGAIPTL
jgi:hypothetical protein